MPTIKQSLYEADFDRWVNSTVNDLQEKNYDRVDWENLIEEVEGLAKSQRHELNNRLTTLLEHSLKRKYVDSPYDFRGWVETIKRSQREIRNLLKDYPSLRSYWREIFADCYNDAVIFLQEIDDYCYYSFPSDCPFPQDIDKLLNDKFW